MDTIPFSHSLSVLLTLSSITLATETAVSQGNSMANSDSLQNHKKQHSLMPAGGASHMVMLLYQNFQTIPVFILIFSIIL